MARRVLSEGHRRNGAGVWAVSPEDPPPVAPAVAIPDGDTLRYVASLASAAAHEINNPLAVIMGYARLLADQVDAHGRGQIDEILEALSRIQAIVAQMQRVTRIELTEEAPHLPEMLDLKQSSDFHRRP